MDLIFTNGELLFTKEKKRKDNMIDNMIEQAKRVYGTKLWQDRFLHEIYKMYDRNYYIWGDDFKIEIIPKNIINSCALSIKDYDEKQELETEIVIDFNKCELNQFIRLLQNVEENM